LEGSEKRWKNGWVDVLKEKLEEEWILELGPSNREEERSSKKKFGLLIDRNVLRARWAQARRESSSRQCDFHWNNTLSKSCLSVSLLTYCTYSG
jgi:hypothetical protein